MKRNFTERLARAKARHPRLLVGVVGALVAVAVARTALNLGGEVGL